jgi:hypothetical protein
MTKVHRSKDMEWSSLSDLDDCAAQQPNALRAGISDDATAADLFLPVE